MVDLLGLLIFMTVIGIGLLDLQVGLPLFATYRSTSPPRGRGRPQEAGRTGDDNRPLPPGPAR